MAKNDPHYRIVVVAPNERSASNALDTWVHPDGDPLFFRVTSWFRLSPHDEYSCIVTSADAGTDCLHSLQQWYGTHRGPFNPGTLLYFTESRLEG